MKKKTIKKDRKKQLDDIKERWTGIFRNGTFRFITGLLMVAVSILLGLAFTSYFATGKEDQSSLDYASRDELFDINNHIENLIGPWGARAADTLMNGCFGLSAYLIPLFLLMAGVALMRIYRVKLLKWFFNFSFIMVWLSICLAFIENYTSLTVLPDEYNFIRPGGMHGDYACRYLDSQVGIPGLAIILILCALLYCIYLTTRTIAVIRAVFHPRTPLAQLGADLPAYRHKEEEKEDETEEEQEEMPEPADSKELTIDLTPGANGGEEGAAPEDTAVQPDTTHTEIPAVTPQENLPKPEDGLIINPTNEEEKATSEQMAPYNPRLDLENYKFPTISLLDKREDTAPTINMAEQKANQERITSVLKTFGVEISSIRATIGPTVTLYEITPAEGVRIAKIRNLEDDIALSLSAMGIRIIAPIPGKGTIGIEVPNKNPHIVSMESILNSKKFQETKFELPIALGKTITNEVYMTDLAKAPHILVAGATGQGKSVGLNAIITSLLYKKHPSELKFVMVDPKKVEFSIYAPIEKHFLAKVTDDDEDPVITDVTKVIKTLKSLCKEMDDRYDLLKMAKARNIKEYNEKFKNRRLNPNDGHRFLPYIVVIIDEFGDLIMTAGKEIELPIARIAQLARAVGIHMIIATQRPTTNIITGTIKANFPMRIAFKVMSVTDSRTILDRSGANRLIGRGDMLITSGADPVRVQCAFVDTDEIERICDYISKQQGYTSAFELPDVPLDGDGGGDKPASSASLGSSKDPLFEEAARLIVIHQQGSTSLIQRKFAIGYNRAGRLMDQLEQAGIVGPANGSKARAVLCSNEADLDVKLSAMD